MMRKCSACTGYDKIVRAVQDAAQELAHEA